MGSHQVPKSFKVLVVGQVWEILDIAPKSELLPKT